MHQVDVPEPVALECPIQRRPAHAPIFRIARNPRRRHADDGRIAVLCGPAVLGRDEQRLDTAIGKIRAKSADRGRDAVDAWKIDIGDEKRSQGLQGQAQGGQKRTDSGAGNDVCRIVEPEHNARSRDQTCQRNDHPAEFGKVRAHLPRKGNGVERVA